ncbi:hypothetical protein GQ607_007358 [Colletotrichum asianum]|uniref:Uncharacterized protein n=1 Tax=Colletotrichum asianum TaxID=702518 RepID=A0A8H3WE45_9PEZI|nr:hypothetical protein GQ607_007358 [Colletotrichum asianum]
MGFPFLSVSALAVCDICLGMYWTYLPEARYIDIDPDTDTGRFWKRSRGQAGRRRRSLHLEANPETRSPGFERLAAFANR